MLGPLPGKGRATMNSGQTVFSQLIEHLPMHSFRDCVRRYDGNRRTRTFSCWDQLLCMTFAQLTYRESLRDIVTCLRSLGPKLYHAGIRGRVSRSTLADANEPRDWRIYADFAGELIRLPPGLYRQDRFGVALQETVYAFGNLRKLLFGGELMVAVRFSVWLDSWRLLPLVLS